MLRSAVARPFVVVTAVSALFATALVGCSKPAPFRNVLAAGDDTHVEIDAPDGIDTWSVVTKSDVDVVVVRLIGLGADVGAMRARALLPGGVVVADLRPPKGGEFSIALSGRQATWTLEFRLAEGQSPPVRYRMVVEKPAGSLGGPRCVDALRAKNISAWIVSVPVLPAGGLVFPGLGSIALEAVPPSALSAGSPAAGAPPVLHLRGATTLQGEFANLGCEPENVQLNFWDTGKGKPPALSVSSPSGLPLCGREGYPACLSDPAAGRWVSWTVATPEPIGKLSLQCDELYLSSVVIQ